MSQGHGQMDVIYLHRGYLSSVTVCRLSCYKLYEKNKSVKLQTLREKNYQVTNVGFQKIKLSRLPVQRINKFKINKIQCKTAQQSSKPS